MALKRLWKRYVRGRPDAYQAYISLPTEPQTPTMGDVHALIEGVEVAFEGRLDVYARTRRLAVVTDHLSHELFDLEAFETALDRLEALYARSHSVARIEKWRTVNGQLVKTYVVVPVEPLFSSSEEATAAQSIAG
ncbi:hypothetical protein ACLI4Y_01495 [Natrialbaceae archaeon A-CW3]